MRFPTAMRMRFVLLAILLAAAAPSAALGVAAFRTPGSAALCGLSEGEGYPWLICWTPNDGYTLSMGPRTGVPARGTYDPKQRGYIEPVRILRFGKTWRSGVYACTSRRTGLTCTNARRHGWWLGRYRGVRRF